MTIEEKRKALRAFCDTKDDCTNCPLTNESCAFSHYEDDKIDQLYQLTLIEDPITYETDRFYIRTEDGYIFKSNKYLTAAINHCEKLRAQGCICSVYAWNDNSGTWHKLN